jgi:hypothetical protein
MSGFDLGQAQPSSLRKPQVSGTTADIDAGDRNRAALPAADDGLAKDVNAVDLAIAISNHQSALCEII